MVDGAETEKRNYKGSEQPEQYPKTYAEAIGEVEPGAHVEYILSDQTERQQTFEICKSEKQRKIDIVASCENAYQSKEQQHSDIRVSNKDEVGERRNGDYFNQAILENRGSYETGLAGVDEGPDDIGIRGNYNRHDSEECGREAKVS